MNGQTIISSLANNIPLIIAGLGFLGGVLALLFVKPPTYKELADEARALRSERSATEDKLDELRAEFESFKRERNAERALDRRRIGILSDGVEAMWSYIQVLIADMTRLGSPAPQPSEYIEATMRRARRARTGDLTDTGDVPVSPAPSVP